MRKSSQYLKAVGPNAVLFVGLISNSFTAGAIAQTIPQTPTQETSINNPSPERPDQQTTSTNEAAKNTRIVLNLSERRVFLYAGETIVSSYPVAVGAANTPTPQGRFTVSQMVIEPIWQNPWTGELHEPGPNTALGLRWIGFTTTEAGSFGFHGTPTLNSIGQAVSNGCVRMRNEDIVTLFSQVRIGTPVEVNP